MFKSVIIAALFAQSASASLWKRYPRAQEMATPTPVIAETPVPSTDTVFSASTEFSTISMGLFSRVLLGFE
jgi:hypothetical protein